jgi:hypothetical protein
VISVVVVVLVYTSGKVVRLLLIAVEVNTSVSGMTKVTSSSVVKLVSVSTAENRSVENIVVVGSCSFVEVRTVTVGKNDMVVVVPETTSTEVKKLVVKKEASNEDVSVSVTI